MITKAETPKFAIERYNFVSNIVDYVVSIHVGGGAYQSLFFAGSEKECWDFIEGYVNDNKIDSFSIIDLEGHENKYCSYKLSK